MKKFSTKSLQRTIARGDGRSIEDRWEYGMAILDNPKRMSASGKSLRHGATEALIAEAAALGSALSEQEIQRRIRCARTYKTINEIRHAMTDFGTWYDLIQAGFPEVEIDGPDEFEAAGIPTGPPDEFEQLTLIPGAPAVLSIRGRKVDLTAATLGDFKAYCEQSAEITSNFAKRDAQLWAAYHTMLDVTDDMGANVIETWKSATEEEPGE